MTESNKVIHLTESKTFCMAPWVHLHSTPSGVVAPCCISESCASDTGMGDSKTQSLMELVNSPKMKQLRLDMLSGIKNIECTKCYNHEEQGISSFRQHNNKDWGNAYYDDVIGNTLVDGSLTDFKMRYFDIRFSNICNFKCRTCGSGFSTQWEQEDLKHKVYHARIIPKNNNPIFLQEVVNQIPHMKTAYFAGGEPLITEEHYILLEEMIRQKRTDISLRYNTNLSNLKFKDKDLLGLWKHFNSDVSVYASIDHYGGRAEYIRHGTDWAQVENNFLMAKKTKFIHLQMNTVLSVFNFLTINEFYQYLIDKKLYDQKSYSNTLYNMSVPTFLACHILPQEYKEKGKASLESAIKLLTAKKFKPDRIKTLQDAIPWVFSEDSWEQNKNEFRTEIKRLDKIRGENFAKTFPELAPLLDSDRKKLWPV